MAAPWAHPSWAQALQLNLNGVPDNGGSRCAALSHCKQSGGINSVAVDSGILRHIASPLLYANAELWYAGPWRYRAAGLEGRSDAFPSKEVAQQRADGY